MDSQASDETDAGFHRDLASFFIFGRSRQGFSTGVAHIAAHVAANIVAQIEEQPWITHVAIGQK